jgi:F0F1-type ATP synthase epsilon subunit
MVSKKEEAPTLRLEVLSLGSGGLMLEGITNVQLKLADGSWLGIRPGHAPLIAATDDGLLKYKQDGEEQTAPVKAGIMTLSNNLISILTTH